MNITLPSRGDDILTWARSITTGVNALAPIGGRGTLVKESVNGFGFEGLPQNKRERKLTDSYILPWTFKCTIGEDPTTHEETRTGGWYNARLQIGLNTNVTGKCGAEIGAQSQSQSDDIQGLDQTDDGTYYVEVDLVDETAELKIADGGNIPPNDFVHNKVNVYIGTVDDGIQTDGIFFVPCVYKRLD